MSNPSTIALSHQMALQNQLDVIANNIANSSTPGFQGQRIMFEEFLADLPDGEQMSYVQDTGILRDVTAGPIGPTGNPLDVSIQGEGYFVVETTAGTRNYTRDGSFRLDPNGQLVTIGGHAVLGEGDVPFVFAPGETQIDISPEGQVSTENGLIGRLRVVTFDNEQLLTPIGNGLLETEQAPLEAPDSAFVQGALEGANVRPILEVTRMIEVLRSYQSASRIVETEGERERRTIQSLTRSV